MLTWAAQLPAESPPAAHTPLPVRAARRAGHHRQKRRAPTSATPAAGPAAEVECHACAAPAPSAHVTSTVTFGFASTSQAATSAVAPAVATARRASAAPAPSAEFRPRELRLAACAGASRKQFGPTWQVVVKQRQRSAYAPVCLSDSAAQDMPTRVTLLHGI